MKDFNYGLLKQKHIFEDRCSVSANGLQDLISYSLNAQRSFEELQDDIKASESERDELQRINIELSAITADVQYLQDMLAVCSAERDELKANLAEMEKQEPVAWRSKDNDFTISEDTVYRWKEFEWKPLYAQPKPSAPAQRITEQDAREIGANFYYANIEPNDEKTVSEVSQMLSVWLASSQGKFLLDKLNEHREPVAPNDRDRSLSENSDLVKSIQDIWFKSGCAHLMNKTTAMNIIDAVVTANKVEVPDSVKWSLHWLKAALECKSFGWDADQRECALMELNNAQKWLDSLQPLKDGE